MATNLHPAFVEGRQAAKAGLPCDNPYEDKPRSRNQQECADEWLAGYESHGYAKPD